MSQFLRIESVKASIKIETSKAAMQIRSGRAQMNVERTVNGLDIKTEAAKLLISNRGLRESIDSMKPSLTFMSETAESGMQAALEATGDTVEKGNAMVKPHTSIADIAASRQIHTIETAIDFIPRSGPEISSTQPVLEINYTPDDLNIDWEISKPEISYTPYDVKISVLSYPKVNIEYLG